MPIHSRFSTIMEITTRYKKVQNRTESAIKDINTLRSVISYAVRAYQNLYSKNICAECKISQSVNYIYLGCD